MKKKLPGIFLMLSLGLLLGACSSKTDKIQEEGDQQEALMEQEETEEENEESQEQEKVSGQQITVLLAGEKEEQETVLSDLLLEEGYQVQTEYAGMDSKTQAQQLEKAARAQAAAVVVEPVKTSGMEASLEKAAEAGVGIICYGQLFMNTEYVDAYVVNDHYEQGVQTALQIEELQDLEHRTEENPVTLEIFLEDGNNINDQVFYLGLMGTLATYVEDDVLVIRSGRDTFQEVTVQDSSKENARVLCEEILEDFYQEDGPDVIYASGDLMTQGVCSALDKAGFAVPGETGEEEGTDQSREKADTEETVPEWPMVIGSGFTVLTANRISTGRQTMAFHQEEDALAECCVQALEEYFTGEQSDDVSSEYDNGVEIVPAYTAAPVPVDFSNYEDFLEEEQGE